jgi:signal transduction histidine kinase
MPKRAVADDLAEALHQAVGKQHQAGRLLHDEVGPLLSTAGLRLQLLRMDFPAAADRVQEVMELLDEAMERVRALSQALNPSPAHRSGLKNALASLIDSSRERFPGTIRLLFSSPARPPADIAAAIYEAVKVAVADAVEHADATLIQVYVRGSKQMSVRVKDNGGAVRSHRALALAALLARHAGLIFDVQTGKGTIVNITHVLRRPSRG